MLPGYTLSPALECKLQEGRGLVGSVWFFSRAPYHVGAQDRTAGKVNESRRSLGHGWPRECRGRGRDGWGSYHSAGKVHSPFLPGLPACLPSSPAGVCLVYTSLLIAPLLTLTPHYLDLVDCCPFGTLVLASMTSVFPDVHHLMVTPHGDFIPTR